MCFKDSLNKMAGRIINDCKAISLIQHIQYEKRTGTFGTDIFEEATLCGTLGKDAIESTKSLYDLVVVDSEGIEKSFAESLEAENDEVVYSVVKTYQDLYNAVTK